MWHDDINDFTRAASPVRLGSVFENGVQRLLAAEIYGVVSLKGERKTAGAHLKIAPLFFGSVLNSSAR